MMKKATTVLGVIALGFGLSQAAQAECSIPLEVVGTKSETIKTYNADGTAKGTIEKATAVKQKALDCDESLGLVKIKLANDEVVWIKRSETRRVADAGAPSKVCVKETVSRASDYSATAVAGVEPKAAGCQPASK
jgi:hypothetical protein